MSASAPAGLGGLPVQVERVLNDFVESARSVLAEDLRSIILYGSGAEGRLRPTSDVNLILVLSRFDHSKADELRVPLQAAQAAIRLTVMFLLESEIGLATEAFAVKFADIRRRRRLLYGTDPFAGLSVPPSAVVARLKQVLLNLRLRLRSAYLSRGLREEQMAALVADSAGPIRAAAAALLELEGQRAGSPKEALERVCASLSGPQWNEVLARLSAAREKRILPPGVAKSTVCDLMELTARLQARAESLSQSVT